MILAFISSRMFQTGLIFVGICLRARHFFENRSFWQDEICLAMSIVNRSFQEIWQHVLLFPDFAQAPMLFQVIEKCFVNLFGNSEMSLRLFPFLVSIASLFMARRFFKRLLSPAAASLALGLFVLIEPLVYFAAELKPYGIDVLAALIVYDVLMNVRSRFTPTRVMVLALVGAAVIWFSYAMLFIMAACGAVLFYEEFYRRDFRRMTALFLCYLVWALSFAALYQVSLVKMLNPDLVRNWHNAGGFAPHSFFSAEGMVWMGQAFLNMFRSPLGMAWPWLMLSFLGVGAVCFYLNNRFWAFFLLAPLGLTILAAAFEKYPFFERLLLFLVPALLVVFAAGVEDLMTRVKRFGSWVVLLMCCVVFWFPLKTAFFKAIAPRGQEENREAMRYIADHFLPGDEIIISNQAQYPFWYYGQKYGLIKKLQLQPVPGGGVAAWTVQLFPDPVHDKGIDLMVLRRSLGVYDVDGFFRKLIFIKQASNPIFIPVLAPKALEGKGRVWVFLSHHNTSAYPGFIDAAFSRAGTKLDSFVRPNAAVYLYKL